jgi:hypothetical protein
MPDGEWLARQVSRPIISNRINADTRSVEKPDLLGWPPRLGLTNKSGIRDNPVFVHIRLVNLSGPVTRHFKPDKHGHSVNRKTRFVELPGCAPFAWCCGRI